MAVDESPPDLAPSLETTVGETLGETVEWTLGTTDEGYRLSLPDRLIELTSREGPADSLHWTVALSSEGKVVSKFGPYESIDSLLDQVRTILTAEVQYTVCCDG